MQPFLDRYFDGRADVTVYELRPFMVSYGDDSKNVMAIVAMQLIERGLIEGFWDLLVHVSQHLALEEDP